MANIGDKKILHHKIWQDGSARHSEYWTLWQYEKRLLRKPKWYQVEEPVMDYKMPIRYWRKDEAQAVAKHYKISIIRANP